MAGPDRRRERRKSISRGCCEGPVRSAMQAKMAVFLLRFSASRYHPHIPRLLLAIVFVSVLAVLAKLPSASAVNLTCYSCYTEDENDVCYSNVSAAKTQRCNHTIPGVACSVYRQDVMGKFTFIVRGCNASCVQKCGAWGENVDVDKCSSCCTTDLCNVDDDASTLTSDTDTWRRVWLIAVIALGSRILAGL